MSALQPAASGDGWGPHTGGEWEDQNQLHLWVKLQGRHKAEAKQAGTPNPSGAPPINAEIEL